MKKSTTFIIIIISILLVILYTIAGTYAVVINVIEKDGVTEIVNKINIRDLLTNDDGSFNDTYYMTKNELNLTDEEASILMDSKALNDNLQIVVESIVEYKVHNNVQAKLSNDELYNLIEEGINNTDEVNEDLKNRILNKANIYKNDISNFVYQTEVSLLEDYQ